MRKGSFCHICGIVRDTVEGRLGETFSGRKQLSTDAGTGIAREAIEGRWGDIT